MNINERIWKQFGIILLFSRSHYDELIESGLLRPIRDNSIIGRKATDDGTIDYVMPNGSSSIVRHFFQKSGMKIDFDKFIDSLKVDGNRWNVTTKVSLKASVKMSFSI
jgi:hypothetical protein